MADKKTTKKEWYGIIRKLVEESDHEKKNEIKNFIDNEVRLIEEKAAKTKENAAKKKAEGDELREAVYAVLTDEPQTIDEIFSQIEGEGLKKQMITARLTQLVKAEKVVKSTVKTEDGRRVQAYKVAE